LAITVLFVVLVRSTGYISLASIVCAAVFPIALLAIHPSNALLLACIVASLLIIYRHRTNIERLRSGREHVFSLKGGKTA
jgi:glycerol-3-phosphate acyltransferase PlsY